MVYNKQISKFHLNILIQVFMIDKNFFYTNRILFPLSLVLFEFTVYIANDMIQPAMLIVIKDFHEDIKWVPTSLTAYLFGGLSLQWLFGPLSDKFGRRPVMLSGVIFFIISCLAILLAENIKQFMFIRFLQGIGLCFIGAVGYATIQETFEEKFCIKIISLMANISLIAPLFGPLIGSILMNIIPWKYIFIFFAGLGFISFIGLFLFMPETILTNKIVSIFIIFSCYKKILKNKKFIFGALSIGFANLPLLSWIALSPLILIDAGKLTITCYAILQIPVFSGLIIGNFILSHLIKTKNLIQLTELGNKPMVLGLIIASFSYFYKQQFFLLTTLGLCIYSCGLGITNACLTRLTLFSTNESKGTVSATMGIISMLIMIIGIELSKNFYLFYNQANIFNTCNLFEGMLCSLLILLFLKNK